ncbi:hypothetical protein [Amycolatopsis arida]|uniref:hypothetical protein n=1 Tax=Amycolatopsis arida TaxID=587909 RepID=UPI001065FCD2|nr:hypothetical protein [Amycolatopsis arida]TDX84944.1 hypothetical protein CLV69_11728 [Amycolatopsis arida]
MMRNTHVLVAAVAVAAALTACKPATASEIGGGGDTGLCEPNPKQRCPGLYADLYDATFGPYPYEGGDPWSECGSWGTIYRDEAIKLAEQCPPLTRGDISAPTQGGR